MPTKLTERYLRALLNGASKNLEMQPHAFRIKRGLKDECTLEIVNCEGRPLAVAATFNLRRRGSVILTDIHRAFEIRLSQ